VGLGCTVRYMDIMEGVRVGLTYIILYQRLFTLGCTGRYMANVEGLRWGFWCTGRYMDVMEVLRGFY
jgi:hypothetical protein